MNQFNDLLQVGLIAQLVRALHRYGRGQGLESRTSLNFLGCLSFCNCKSKSDWVSPRFLSLDATIFKTPQHTVRCDLLVLFCTEIGLNKRWNNIAAVHFYSGDLKQASFVLFFA